MPTGQFAIGSQGAVAAGKRFEQVLDAARGGQEWGFAALYRGLQPTLLGYLRAQRPHEAEDLASETWIAVARGLWSFRGGESDFRRWVFTIARRRLIDLARAESSRPRPAFERTTPPEGESPDSESEALARIATREALALVSQLPSGEAEVITLRVIAGLTTRDVAAITGRTAVGVRVTQHRALRRLRVLLSTVLVTLQGRFAI
jgi:RNA polymerase sigma-70 factor (ECF subfamily)